jgi:hypothetical protein
VTHRPWLRDARITDIERGGRLQDLHARYVVVFYYAHGADAIESNPIERVKLPIDAH